MVFKNIGNFGKKISEYNSERRKKNMDKLRLEAEKAKQKELEIKEKVKLKKQIAKSKQIQEQEDPNAFQKLKKFAENIEKKNQSKQKSEMPSLFGQNKPKNENMFKSGNKFKL